MTESLNDLLGAPLWARLLLPSAIYRRYFERQPATIDSLQRLVDGRLAAAGVRLPKIRPEAAEMPPCTSIEKAVLAIDESTYGRLQLPFAQWPVLPSSSSTSWSSVSLEELSKLVAIRLIDARLEIDAHLLAYEAITHGLRHDPRSFRQLWRDDTLDCARLLDTSVTGPMTLASPQAVAEAATALGGEPAHLFPALAAGIWAGYAAVAARAPDLDMQGGRRCRLPRMPDRFLRHTIRTLPHQAFLSSLDPRVVPRRARAAMLKRIVNDTRDGPVFRLLAEAESIGAIEQALSDSTDYLTLQTLASRRGTSRATLDRLACSGDSEVAAEAARNPGTSSHTLAACARHENAFARAAVAANPSTPCSVWPQLLWDPTPYVRASVAERPSLGAEQRLSLLFDFDPFVQVAAARRLDTLLPHLRLTDWAHHLFGSAGARVCRVLSSILAQRPRADFGWIPATARILRVVYERDRLQLADTLGELAKEPPMHAIVAHWDAPDCRIIGELLRGQSPERIARILRTIEIRDRRIGDLRVLFPTSILLRRAARALRDPAWEDMGLLLSTLREAGEAQRIKDRPDTVQLEQQERQPALAELDGTPVLPGLRFFVPATAGDLERLGRQLQNCLGTGTYTVGVATGKAYVVALVDDLDAPRYVLELDEDGKILQSSGQRNEPMDPDVGKVVGRILARRLRRVRDA